MKNLIPIFCLLFMLSLFQSGCTRLNSSASMTLSPQSSLIVLPIRNLAQTPQAGKKAETLVASLLYNKGLKTVRHYPESEGQSLAMFLDDAKRLEKEQIAAQEAGIQYGLTGTVQEWSYKTGLDGEPTVGLTLTLIDLQKGQVVWTATASRTGWGSANLSSTAAEVIETLLGTLHFQP